MPASVLCAWVVWCCAALPVGVAVADDGIHVDPDSAPAAEYALPLQDARSQGSAPTSESTAGGGAPGAPPAFGTGISRRGSPAADTPRAAADRGSGGLAVAATGDASRAGSVLFTAGCGLAVLLAGAGLALTLRRRPSAG